MISSGSSSRSDGTESFGYDLDGNLISAANTVSGSAVASNTYQYNYLGDATAENIVLASVSENVVLSSLYDARSELVGLSANLGGTLNSNGSVSGGIKDFQNSYTYNVQGEVTGATQSAQTGGSDNGISSKNVAMAYNFNGQMTSIDFYNSTTTSNQAVVGSYTYNADSLLTDLTYTAQSSTIGGYHWDYNSDGIVTDEYSRNDTSGTPGGSYSSWAETTYTYNHDSELTGTSYSTFANPPSSNTSQSFDSNGNRTNVSVPGYLASNTGAGNRLLFDGTYTYSYDGNGNRTAQWVNNNGVAESSPQSGDTDITIYGWNNRDQLVSANYYATYADYNSNTPTSTSDYAYDAFGHMVMSDPIGATEYYINDGQQLDLIVNSAGQVTERELTAPGVDQVFGGEEVTPGSGGGTQSSGTINWLLVNSEGSATDEAQYSSGSTSIVDSIVYDSFGQITYQITPSDQPTFTYMGQRYDSNTGLYYEGSGSSWYSAVDGVFASQGAPGYNGSANNPFEYMGNNPNMSQSSAGYIPGDIASGVGIAGSGGSAVPVYYAGPTTLPPSGPTPIPPLVILPKPNTSSPAPPASSFNRPTASVGAGAKPAAATTTTPPATQGVPAQDKSGNANPAPSTPLTAAIEQALDRAKAQELVDQASDQLSAKQALYTAAKRSVAPKAALDILARAVGVAWAGLWKARINLWFVGFHNPVAIALNNLLNAFVNVLNALNNYQTSTAEFGRQSELAGKKAGTYTKLIAAWLANRNDMHDLNIAVIGLGQAANILADALYRFFVPNNSIAKGAG